VDFLSRRINSEKFGPTVLSFVILVRSYDCEKQLSQEESVEWHKIDGSVPLTYQQIPSGTQRQQDENDNRNQQNPEERLT
jgi:hypothetical protein